MQCGNIKYNKNYKMLHKRSLFNRRWVEGWHSSDNSELERCFLLFLRLHYLQCSLWDPERTVGHRGHQPPAEPELNLDKERKNTKGILAATINDKYLKTHLPSLLLLHTSRVSITIFPRVLRDTFYKEMEVLYPKTIIMHAIFTP